MINKLCFTAILLLLSVSYVVAQAITITVVDAQTREGLIGAYVSNCINKKVLVTDDTGQVLIDKTFADKCIVISYLGYTADTLFFSQLTNNPIVELSPAVNAAAEIVVSAKKEYGGSVAKLKSEDIIYIPILLGEADPLRALAREPGISMGAEGSARIYVRGALPSQNLMLLDGIPIYNATHAGPLFSAFDGNLIQDISVHKITSPVEYGSGLSSLVEVNTNAPEPAEWKLKYSVGIVGSSIYTSGPLSPKTSILFGMRVSLPSLINIGRNRNTNEDIVDYRLADGHFKLRHDINESKHLTFQYFQSYDEGLFGSNESVASIDTLNDRAFSRFTINWQNRMGSLTYVNQLSMASRWKTMLYGSQYLTKSVDNNLKFSRDQVTSNTAVEINSQLIDFGLRSWLTHDFRGFVLKEGLSVNRRRFSPLSFVRTFDSTPVTNNISDQSQILEGAVFVQADKTFAEKHSLGVGLRLSNFVNQTDEFNSIDLAAWARYKFKVSDRLNFGLAAENTVQYNHGFSSVNEAWELNVWLPSGNYLLPQRAAQLELNGTYFISSNFRTNLSAYYRKSNNISRTRLNSLTNINADDEAFNERFLNGGNASNRGIEATINGGNDRYNIGGAYTLAYTTHQFELINRSNPYPSRFDRRHDLAVWGSYHFSSKWMVNLQWIYQSGIAFTTPVALIVRSNGIFANVVNEEINNGRFPVAHRLDASVVRQWTGRKGHANNLTFGLYNAYNRAYPNTLRLVSRDGVFPRSGNAINLKFPRRIVRSEGLFGLTPFVTYRKEFLWKRS